MFVTVKPVHLSCTAPLYIDIAMHTIQAGKEVLRFPFLISCCRGQCTLEPCKMSGGYVCIFPHPSYTELCQTISFCAQDRADWHATRGCEGERINSGQSVLHWPPGPRLRTLLSGPRRIHIPAMLSTNEHLFSFWRFLTFTIHTCLAGYIQQTCRLIREDHRVEDIHFCLLAVNYPCLDSNLQRGFCIYRLHISPLQNLLDHVSCMTIIPVNVTS